MYTYTRLDMHIGRNESKYVMCMRCVYVSTQFPAVNLFLFYKCTNVIFIAKYFSKATKGCTYVRTIRILILA